MDFFNKDRYFKVGVKYFNENMYGECLRNFNMVLTSSLYSVEDKIKSLYYISFCEANGYDMKKNVVSAYKNFSVVQKYVKDENYKKLAEIQIKKISNGAVKKLAEDKSFNIAFVKKILVPTFGDNHLFKEMVINPLLMNHDKKTIDEVLDAFMPKFNEISKSIKDKNKVDKQESPYKGFNFTKRNDITILVTELKDNLHCGDFSLVGFVANSKGQRAFVTRRVYDNFAINEIYYNNKYNNTFVEFADLAELDFDAKLPYKSEDYSIQRFEDYIYACLIKLGFNHENLGYNFNPEIIKEEAKNKNEYALTLLGIKSESVKPLKEAAKQNFTVSMVIILERFIDDISLKEAKRYLKKIKESDLVSEEYYFELYNKVFFKFNEAI